MNNIAIFVDFVNGRLTGKSIKLLNKVIGLKYDKYVVYTFSRCQEYFLPQIPGIDLVVIESNSSITFTDSCIVSSISNDLLQREISNGFAIKSPLTDILIPQIAVSINSTVKSQVIDFNRHDEGISYAISVFNNKAECYYSVINQTSFYLVNNNFKTVSNGDGQQVYSVQPKFLKPVASSYSVVSIDAVSNNQISLNDADIVVGAGRGLKDPSNWPMVEEFASLLNAATACSKPVSDLDWRPHHEHVGQTGVKIAPNLYIACGISGAIQHLAGVNSSKTIVVINNDRDAPFFNHADYGIVGDVFDVLPRLIKKLKS
jgi:electron transfer flavoprotein alpha subunit